MKSLMFQILWVAPILLLAASCTSPSDEELYSSELLKSDFLWADPQVTRDCLGSNGKTTIHWDVPKARKIEIHVNSAEGNLFTVSGSRGSKETGYWVKDGMKFVLLNAENGEELALINVKVLCGE